ncbi:MAG: NAD+ synthase [Anaerolineae bacterium]
MNLGDEISQWIKKEVVEAKARGVVVGLSGGVDSSTVAVLAKRALGEGVLGLLMPCYSNPGDLEHARLVAEQFNIRTEYVDLTPVFDQFTKILPPGNRIARGNLKPRLRMITLYYFANRENYLVAGTGNKSELMVGYFTKYGDGGVDILPLGNLLKTQVRELARELGIPQAIIDKPPSAGLWDGQTDEGELGITYVELDRTLNAIETGQIQECDPKTRAQVQDMITRSEHKRRLAHLFVPPKT